MIFLPALSDRFLIAMNSTFTPHNWQDTPPAPQMERAPHARNSEH
jgi:hypothetical protein